MKKIVIVKLGGHAIEMELTIADGIGALRPLDDRPLDNGVIQSKSKVIGYSPKGEVLRNRWSVVHSTR